MKLLIALGHDGQLDYADIAERSWSDYSKRQGYDMRVYAFPRDRIGEHPSWHKLWLMQSLIREAIYDWIAWADADTVVTNLSWDMAALIAATDLKHPGVWMIVSRDWSDGPSPWSAGVMLLRRCSEAEIFFREAEKHTEWKNAGCWDQSAMQALGPQPGIVVLPRRVLISVPDEVQPTPDPWRPGDPIVHITGFPQHRRRALMEKYATQAIK
jgi:hypothetical protein